MAGGQIRGFGNLINRVQEQVKSQAPTIGMGATELLYSDRHAYTVVEIFSPKKIKVQQDQAIRVDKNGCSESQTYVYKRDRNGSTRVLTLRKNGWWIPEGEKLRSGTVLSLGKRDEHYDFSF